MKGKVLGLLLLCLLLGTSGVLAQEIMNITIVNNTGYPVLAVYIMPMDGVDWEENLLAEGEHILAGTELVIPYTNWSGVYHVKLVDTDYDSYLQEYLLLEDGTVIEFLFDHIRWGYEESEVALLNETGFRVIEVYVTPADSSDWGENLLADRGYLDQGEGIYVEADWSDNLYNICFIDEDYDPYYRWNVGLWDFELAMTFEDFYRSATVSEIIIENATNQEFVELYIRTPYVDGTENQLATGEVILPGETLVIAWDGPSAHYDISVVDGNGQAYYRYYEYLSGIAYLEINRDHLDTWAYGCFSVFIENGTDYDMVELYVAPVNASGWGENILDGRELKPGDWHALDCELYAEGLHDILFVNEKGYEYFRWNVRIDYLDFVITEEDRSRGRHFEQLTLVNATDTTLVELNIAPSIFFDWGRNLLVEGMTIPPHSSIVLPLSLLSSEYDVRVITEEEGAFFKFDQYLGGAVELIFTDEDFFGPIVRSLVTIENQTAEALQEVYVTPMGMRFFGRNLLLESETIASGEHFSFLVDDQDALYSFRVVGTSGERYQKDSVLVEDNLKLTFSLADQRQIQANALEFLNDTGYPIYEIYIAPTGSLSWGRNVLPANTEIAPGHSYVLSADGDSPLFDIRFVDTDNDYYHVEALDFRAYEEYYLTFDYFRGYVNAYRLTLRNETGYPAEGFYMMQAERDSFGDNLLDEILPDKGSVIFLVDPEVLEYDFLLVDTDWDHYYLWNVENTEDQVLVFTFDHFWELRPEYRLHIKNDTALPVSSLFVAPSHQTLWGYTRLPYETLLLPGEILTVVLVREGAYDVRLVTTEGTNHYVFEVVVDEDKEVVVQ